MLLTRVRSILPVVLAALFIVWAPSSAAAYVVPFSLDQLTQLADTVVEVRVLDGTARATRAGTRIARIDTETRTVVLRTFKGRARTGLTITQPGGTADGITLAVTEMPSFEPGDHAIVFLDANGVVGGHQGKLTIVGDEVPGLGLSLEQARQAIRDRVGSPTSTPAPDSETANGSELTTSDVTVASAPVVLLDSTFEGPSTTGWSMSGTPTWGVSSYRRATGTYALYGSGAGSGAVAAPGPSPVTVFANATRTSAINLSSYNAATLEWDVWTGLSQSNWMNVQLATSTAGPWYTPQGTFATGSGHGWRHFTLDLRSVVDQFGAGSIDLTGQSAVYVRLANLHTSGTADEGVYVDNVRLTAQSIVSPVVTSISPSLANAGVGERVTIDGSGFGATRGTGTVEFLVGNSQSGARVNATGIVSWSDTRIVLEVPRRAQSGPVWVTDSSGISNAGHFYEVGFSASGVSWASSDRPVTYNINENTADTTGERAAITAAMQTWNAAGSDMRFAAGTNSAISSYPPVRDSSNDIFFTRDSMPTGVLAQHFSWSSGARMLESNIVFNDAAYTWATGAVTGAFDIESVALHELGHAVGLDDQYAATNRVMGAMASGATRRNLSAYEIAGAIHIYGVDTSIAPDAPQISSATHASQTAWSNSAAPAFDFSATSASGVSGYSYVLDRNAATVPDTVSEGTAVSASYSGLAQGEWYFHVRAVSSHGVWGDATHYRVRIDTTAPVVSVTAEEIATAPVTVSVSATDAHSGVASVQLTLDGTPIGGSSVTISKTGVYRLAHRVTDNAGNVAIGETGFEVLAGDEKPAIEVDAVIGANRFETAVETSKRAFPHGLPTDGPRTVVLATGRNWPDALGGTGLAGALESPMLLVDRDSVPTVVMNEIRRLGAQKAIILGGTSAVSDTVRSALAHELGGASRVERISGTNRYQTADKVAARVLELLGAAYDGTAVVTTGANYPDALAVSPLAAANGWPLFLAQPGKGMTAGSLAVMGEPDRILILGGEAAVDASTESALAKSFPAAEVRRLKGPDRYQTAVTVATFGAAEAGLSWDNVAIATGQDFPDALAGGVLQGARGSVMVLTRTTKMCAATLGALESHKADIYRVTYLGGYGAVCTDVRGKVVQVLE